MSPVDLPQGLTEQLLGGRPPRLDLEPRPETLAEGDIRRLVEAWAGRRRLDRRSARLLLGAGLLWHDHGEGAHATAQAREGDPDFDLLHAAFHRREGDFGNSAYWLRSAGDHPCYPGIARAARDALQGRPSLGAVLCPGGRWDPHAFLEAVRAALGKGAAGREKRPGAEDADADVLRLLQRAELQGLLAHALERAFPHPLHWKDFVTAPAPVSRRRK